MSFQITVENSTILVIFLSAIFRTELVMATGVRLDFEIIGKGLPIAYVIWTFFKKSWSYGILVVKYTRT